jgi:glycosyltransferase involved in cell wall biosynthesis
LGHQVDIFEPRDFEYGYGARRAIRFRQALGGLGFIRSRLRERHYDMIEFFGGEFGLASKLLARERPRPLIVAHTDGFELLASERELHFAPPASALAGRLRRWYRRQTHDRLSRAAFAFADAAVAGCELDRSRIVELGLRPRERTVVISPGIDDEYGSATAQDPRQQRVAFTGSWIARKGVRHVVGVMSELMGSKPDLHLDLYGTFVSADRVLAEFPACVRDRVAVQESYAQNAAGLSKAKVFFFPTQYEGFGMALAEAMACGCAPVTTPTGFGAELRHGEEALLCDFDDTGAMRKAILALLDDERLRGRIARAASQRARSLRWEAQVRRLEATYSAWLLENKT